jgi:hypothetical protein
MSHYARNHLQDDWASHAHEDTRRRVQAAEKEAGWYFDKAVRGEKAEFDAAMRVLFGVTSPRADRERERVRRRWQEATAEPRALLDATVECLLATGEVSAELDELWTALIDRDAQRLSAAEKTVGVRSGRAGSGSEE